MEEVDDKAEGENVVYITYDPEKHQGVVRGRGSQEGPRAIDVSLKLADIEHSAICLR